MAWHTHGKPACGVKVTEQDIGNGVAALFAGIIGREQGVGVFVSPVLVERTAFYIDHHERLAGGFERFQQGHLQAQQVQRAAVEAFAGLHVGDGRLVHHGGAGILVGCLEVPRR